MSKESISKETIDNLLIGLATRGEALKEQGIITDWEIGTTFENERIGEDGVVEKDLYVTVNIIPNNPPKKIVVDFLITKEGIKFNN